jgi:hypothetical protein
MRILNTRNKLDLFKLPEILRTQKSNDFLNFLASKILELKNAKRCNKNNLEFCKKLKKTKHSERL